MILFIFFIFGSRESIRVMIRVDEIKFWAFAYKYNAWEVENFLTLLTNLIFVFCLYLLYAVTPSNWVWHDMRNTKSTKTNNRFWHRNAYSKETEQTTLRLYIYHSLWFGMLLSQLVPQSKHIVVKRTHVNIVKRTCYCNSLHKIQIRLVWFCFISASILFYSTFE